jgi:phosphopantetheine--protein transferase-like protein
MSRAKGIFGTWSAVRGFFKKIFSLREIAQCLEVDDPSGRFARRFACKEALIKAAGWKGTPLTKIEIVSDRGGGPKVVWPGLEKKGLAAKVSLSSEGGLAVAVALVGLTSKRISPPGITNPDV